MTRLTFIPVEVATGCEDKGGMLAYVDDQLCAVLVRLDEQLHGSAGGRWNIEAGFGMCDGQPNSFPSLAEAARWIARRMDVSMMDAYQAASAAMAHGGQALGPR